MTEQQIAELEKKFDKPDKKENPFRYWSRFYDKYRKIIDYILKDNINTPWSDVYHKISEKVPKNIRYLFISEHVFFPNRNGEYVLRYGKKTKFDPTKPSLWYDILYVDQNDILRMTPKYTPIKPKYYKRIKKKIPKPDPLFKFDYVLEITTHVTKNKERLFGRTYVQTGTKLNKDGEEVSHFTYFSKEGFMDWAHRHQKTYKLTIKEYQYYGGTTYQTIEKRSYDN